jgi:hypothetical protein
MYTIDCQGFLFLIDLESWVSYFDRLLQLLDDFLAVNCLVRFRSEWNVCMTGYNKRRSWNESSALDLYNLWPSNWYLLITFLHLFWLDVYWNVGDSLYLYWCFILRGYVLILTDFYNSLVFFSIFCFTLYIFVFNFFH